MLTRRTLLAGAASAIPLAGLAARPPEDDRAMLLPPRLKVGDKVAIVAPAGAASSPQSVADAKARLEGLGFPVTVGDHVLARWGYLAGSDEERASDLNSAIQNPEIRAIFTLRGGYGVTRTLPRVDYESFRKDPKVLIGYSDITALLNAVTRKSRVVTYHGPVATSRFEGFELDWFRKALMEPDVPLEFGFASELEGRPASPTRRTIQAGKATGPLIGGNLALISACVGTDYAPIFDGAILFLEDVNEAPYKVDRMLTQLWLSGHLQKIKGLFFGDFRLPAAERTESDAPQDPAKTFSMDQVFDNLRQWLTIPVACGLATGHLPAKLTLPIGRHVEFDADRQSLSIANWPSA